MTEPSVPTKRIKRRPLYIWTLFFIFVLLSSVLWAWFIMDSTFIHRDYGTIPPPIGMSIRNIVIAAAPLTVAIYALFRK